MLSLRVPFLTLLNYVQVHLSQPVTLNCYLPIPFYSFNSHTNFCVFTLYNIKVCTVAPEHPTPSWCGLIYSLQHLAWCCCKVAPPRAYLESLVGHKRWCIAAVDRWAVHNNPQSVGPNQVFSGFH